MKINTRILRFFGFLCSIVVICCSPRNEIESEKQINLGPRKVKIDSGKQIYPGGLPPAVDKVDIKGNAFTIPEAAKKLINRGSGAQDTWEVIATMQMIVHKWSPVGKTIEEIETAIGNPSRHEKNALVYAFDTGMLHYEWWFHTKEGTISKVTENHSLE